MLCSNIFIARLFDLLLQIFSQLFSCFRFAWDLFTPLNLYYLESVLLLICYFCICIFIVSYFFIQIDQLLQHFLSVFFLVTWLILLFSYLSFSFASFLCLFQFSVLSIPRISSAGLFALRSFSSVPQLLFISSILNCTNDTSVLFFSSLVTVAVFPLPLISWFFQFSILMRFFKNFLAGSPL